jgi:hypothetical protein
MDLTDIKNLPADELKAIIRDLQATLDEKQGKPTLASFINPLSDNFMGTGMSLQEFHVKGMIEVWQRSFSNQNRKEKKRRLHTIVKLSAELERIREKTLNATGLAESVIEDVIEGDWKMLKEWAEMFTFKDEGEEHRTFMAPIYARFVETCREVHEERPEVRELH